MDATELFAPLGPGYDRWGSMLSFGQDPRWRRFLVSRIDAGPTDTVLDVATGTAAVALELVRQKDCFVVGIDRTRRDARGGASTRRARRRLAEGPAQSKATRARCRSRTGSSTRSRSRTCSATSTILPSTLRELRARGQARRDDRGPRVRRPRWHLAPAVGALDARRPAGCRAADRQRLARGRHVPQPVDPRASTSSGRSRVCSTAWREAGIEHVQTRRLSVGGGVVTWGRKKSRKAGVLRAPPWRLARLRDAAAPAVHALASVVCRARRRPRTALSPQPAALGARGVLPGDGRRRARARRAEGPTAAHADPDAACWSPSPWSSLAGAVAIGIGAAHAWGWSGCSSSSRSARSPCPRTTSSWRFTTTAALRSLWGAFPVLTGYFVEAQTIRLEAVAGGRVRLPR